MFIPNFNRKELVEFGIHNLITHLPKEDRIIIIGNDLCHCDFRHLEKYGVYYFSLENGRSTPRNSAFIRNYAIKRCQSQIFFQKDPEIIVNGDFLKRASELGKGWKAGWVLNFPKGPTQDILQNGIREIIPFLMEHCLNPQIQKEFEYRDLGGGLSQVLMGLKNLCTANVLKQQILSGKHNLSNWLSYALGIETKVLQDIHGYDEDFTSYGYEDSDMICRLMALGYSISPDHNCTSIHLHHPSTGDPHLHEMRDVFQNKDPNQVVRNPENWGEGE